MEGYTPAGDTSFASHFATFGYSPPKDAVKTASTKGLGTDEADLSGPLFSGLQLFSLDSLTLSEGHSYPWAKTILKSFTPIIPVHHAHMWDALAIWEEAPPGIRSEPERHAHFRKVVMLPCLMGAMALRAEDKNLTETVDHVYPRGRWEVADLTAVGPSGKTDVGVLRRDDSAEPSAQRDAALHPALQAEEKTWHVCGSRGCIDGIYYQRIEVLPRLFAWMKSQPKGYIPIDPPGTSILARPEGGVNWYEEDWQKKIQKFFFQVSFRFCCCEYC